MSVKFSSINWMWVIIGAVVAFVLAVVITLIVNVGYGVVLGFRIARHTAPGHDHCWRHQHALPSSSV